MRLVSALRCFHTAEEVASFFNMGSQFPACDSLFTSAREFR